MRIGICDDVEEEREKSKKICFQVMTHLDAEVEVTEFSDGKEVLNFQGEVDILLLDMEMPYVDGLEVKRRMEEGDSNVLIIFLTSHPELVFQGFGKNVLAFVQKCELEVRLPQVLARALNCIMRNVWIYDEISSRRVLYIQAEDNYQMFFYRNGLHEMRAGRMEDLEHLLEKADFIRTHRKYLVNMYYVDEIKKEKMIVREVEIPIAARLQKEVKDKYAAFRRRQAKLC